ncbi:MAG: phosphoglycerate dehydrogenase [Candidatus Peregrinibacteria bacterium]
MSNFSLAKDKIRVLLLENIHPKGVELFTNAGYKNVTLLPHALTGDELKKELENTHILGIRSKTTLDKEIFKNAPKLMAVGCFCIGTNQVDSLAAQRLGIPVFNAPFSNTRSVAELVMGEIVMLMRNIPEKNALAHRGDWQKSAKNSFEVRGKTLGIIGYGRIGTQVGILAESFGMTVVYHDVETKLPLGNATPAKTLDELLAVSDVVTLHVPATKETNQFFHAHHFSQMKEGSCFLNAARGNIVVIPDLIEALEQKKIRAAAIDVFPEEPASNTEPFLSPLQKFENVILTPHVGGSTEESQVNIGEEVAEKLIKYSDNGSTLSSVNFPEVSLPLHKGTHRILHIHKNTPGVMASLNNFFGTAGVNISAQYLQTKGDIGYVVVDSDTHVSEKVMDHIKSLPETIRTRVLY